VDVGYTGQSPERLKLHMANQHTFDFTTLQGGGRPGGRRLLRHALALLGHAEMKHPGTPNLYDMSKPVAEGGLGFRARFGVERDGDNLLAEKVSYPVGSEIEDGYPEFTMQMLMELGWGRPDRRGTRRRRRGSKTNWKTDLSGGIQRVAIKHGCAPSATPRPAAWSGPSRTRCPSTASRSTPTAAIWWRVPDLRGPQVLPLPTRYASIQATDYSKDYPIILTSGRLVEYEGGGDETRSNPWLAELQQDMFVEINPRDANNLGIRDGGEVWVETPEAARSRSWPWSPSASARRGLHAVPLRRSLPGRGPADKYPEGADPYVLGEACNTASDLWLRLGHRRCRRPKLCKLSPLQNLGGRA
jgi:formate dehydrogenase major subunit